MELEDKDERTFEDFLAFLQLHPELKTWEIGPEPILSLPGLQIYPDRRKIYHGQQEIELNTKEFALGRTFWQRTYRGGQPCPQYAAEIICRIFQTAVCDFLYPGCGVSLRGSFLV